MAKTLKIQFNVEVNFREVLLEKLFKLKQLVN